MRAEREWVSPAGVSFNVSPNVGVESVGVVGVDARDPLMWEVEDGL